MWEWYSLCVQGMGEWGTLEMGFKLASYLIETKSPLCRSAPPPARQRWPAHCEQPPQLLQVEMLPGPQYPCCLWPLHEAKWVWELLPLELSEKNGGESRACGSPDNSVLMWVRSKLGSIWLMAKADKRYGFDVIPDLRLEMELDPSRWACLCNTAGHVVTRREAEEGYRLSRLSVLGEERTGRARHELCMVSEVEGAKENSVKFELVYLWGDELMWGEWYSTVGYESRGKWGCHLDV